MQNYPELFEETSEKKEKDSKEDEPLKEEAKEEEKPPSDDSEKWWKDSLTSGCGICEHIFVSKILLVPNLLVLETDETQGYLQILISFNQPISGSWLQIIWIFSAIVM